MVEHVCGDFISRDNFHLTDIVNTTILRLFGVELGSEVNVSLRLYLVKRSTRFLLKYGGFVRVQSLQQNLDPIFQELHLPLERSVKSLVLLRLHVAPMRYLAELLVREDKSLLPVGSLGELNLKLSDLSVLVLNHGILFTDLLRLMENLLLADGRKSLCENLALRHTIHKDQVHHADI